MSVPDIVTGVFRDRGFTDFERVLFVPQPGPHRDPVAREPIVSGVDVDDAGHPAVPVTERLVGKGKVYRHRRAEELGGLDVGPRAHEVDLVREGRGHPVDAAHRMERDAVA
jgi:hypothetical protein